MEEIQKTQRVSRIEGVDEGENWIVNRGAIVKKALGFIVEKKAPLAVIVIIAFVGYGVYGKYFDLTDAERAQKELSMAVAAVGELMILPEGDEPVLANVTDAEALIKQQAFFAGAMDGDQLLLFPKNMKAVIYSPSRNKIINAGPIEQQSQTNTEQVRNVSQSVPAVTQIPAVLRVAFYNGTKTVGLANEIELKLKASLPDFETTEKTNAVKKDYKETIVVDLTAGEKISSANRIASIISAQVKDFPEGEKLPDADILIIAGERDN